MSTYPYAFEAEVVRHDVGGVRYAYTVVFVPAEICDALPLDEHPRLRVTGEVNDHPIEASLTPTRGAWYVLLSKKFLAQIDARVGDVVDVRFGVADQGAVVVPDALARALEQDAKMGALWDAATPGRRRGLAYMVTSAKADATKAKRIQTVFGILRGDLDARGNPVT